MRQTNEGELPDLSSRSKIVATTDCAQSCYRLAECLGWSNVTMLLHGNSPCISGSHLPVPRIAPLRSNPSTCEGGGGKHMGFSILLCPAAASIHCTLLPLWHILLPLWHPLSISDYAEALRQALCAKWHMTIESSPLLIYLISCNIFFMLGDLEEWIVCRLTTFLELTGFRWGSSLTIPDEPS